MAHATTDTLFDDLKTVVKDAEELLKATAGVAGEKVAAARERAEASVRSARERLSTAQEEVIERTREAAEHADEYTETVRLKIERCLAVTDAEYERSVVARERYREQLAEAAEGVDLVLTPTLELVAPPAPADELALRGRLTRLTFPFNVVGWLSWLSVLRRR